MDIDGNRNFTEGDSTRFMERIRPGDFFVDLISRIPGANFFMKDLEGRIVHCDSGFVEMLKCSPNAYLKRVRVNAVSRSLLDPFPWPRSTGCGFADQNHMTREFRKLMGITPRAYRKQRVAN